MQLPARAINIALREPFTTFVHLVISVVILILMANVTSDIKEVKTTVHALSEQAKTSRVAYWAPVK